MENKYREISKRIRKRILKSVFFNKAGHIGGSFSAVEILLSLYFEELKIFEDNSKHPDRDIFILSKGHGCAALYSVLVEKGFYKEKELLNSFGKINSIFQVHPDCRKVKWAEISTGSLGQGLSIGVGAALADKEYHKSKVFVLLGDGECQEGQIWEAAMAAGNYRLGNLVAIVDNNKGQLMENVENVMALDPFADKWEKFGWHVQSGIDGHNIKELVEAYSAAKRIRNKPSVIIADTIKGKGVSFMEKDGYKWHGKKPNNNEYEKAMKELS